MILHQNLHNVQKWKTYFFDNPDILCIGGYLPIVVMKKDGSFIPMTQYVLTHKSQKELRKFKI